MYPFDWKNGSWKGFGKGSGSERRLEFLIGFRFLTQFRIPSESLNGLMWNSWRSPRRPFVSGFLFASLLGIPF